MTSSKKKNRVASIPLSARIQTAVSIKPVSWAKNGRPLKYMAVVDVSDVVSKEKRRIAGDPSATNKGAISSLIDEINLFAEAARKTLSPIKQIVTAMDDAQSDEIPQNSIITITEHRDDTDVKRARQIDIKRT